MSDRSTIEWTDATWNPVRGCVKVSPGCKHCYAETFAERFRGVPGHPFEQGFDLRLVPEKLDIPLRWRAPRRIFVNSMSDLFQEGVPTDYIAAVGRIMQTAHWHTYQVLTKRHERMRELLRGDLAWMAQLPHVWFGVSVEDRRYGLPRIDALSGTPAALRFLSIEPLLEDLGPIDLTGIDWVIVGGESGHRARPMREAWVLSIRDRCRRARVPFFFKQMRFPECLGFGELLASVKSIEPIELTPPMRCHRMTAPSELPSVGPWARARLERLREYQLLQLAASRGPATLHKRSASADSATR